MSSLFNKDIESLWGVGATRAKLFRKLGVDSIGALLEFYPRTYTDFTNNVSISEAPFNEDCCIKAKIASDFTVRKIRPNMVIYKCHVSDGFSNMELNFFNNKYVLNMLKLNKEYFFLGKMVLKDGFKRMNSPNFEPVTDKMTLKPIYKQTEGLSSRIIEKSVISAFKLLPETLNDCLPVWLRENYNLCDLKFAMYNIHFPEDDQSLKIAKKRILFEQLLVFYLTLLSLKSSNKSNNNFKFSNHFYQDFLQLLDFKLTSSQDKVINECLNDMMYGNSPMNRLIQGDVGCGKTIVAAALSYSVIKNNIQVALMAPTEILANQHYNYFSKLFEGTGIRIELLTSSTKTKPRRRILDYLQCGLIDLIIGTHSLLSDEVQFSNLGLVITDEQHRFGVNQRGKLKNKSDNPHLLVMSATPIPRTMALVMHGDLNVSTIDELPKGRRKVKTYWIGQDKRNRAFQFIKKQIQSGRQAYIVCPAIEDGDIEKLKSIESYKKLLDQSVLKDFKIEALHGKLSDQQKQSLMSSFSSGEIDILLATTVVEVGVDVANANIILIENAERFGLSTIHQLRGRVGRSNFESFCVLVSDATNNDAISRLNTICNTSDGFKISVEDLKLRGPGDFFGTQQHGLIDEVFIEGLKQSETFYQVSSAADEILKKDPELMLPQNRQLKFRVNMKLKSTENN